MSLNVCREPSTRMRGAAARISCSSLDGVRLVDGAGAVLVAAGPVRLGRHDRADYARAMPLQNRVTPLGELIATPARGLVYGNRGCLHDASGRIRRHHNGRRWIACRLRFRGWHRAPLLQPGRFTELFFLDEATAFAAGHRPCALCRREDYNRFLRDRRRAGRRCDRRPPARRALRPATRARRADAAGRRVRAARGRAVARPRRRAAALDAGRLHGAGRATARARRRLITPPTLVAVLRSGWSGAVPLLHGSSQPGERLAADAQS